MVITSLLFLPILRSQNVKTIELPVQSVRASKVAEQIRKTYGNAVFTSAGKVFPHPDANTQAMLDGLRAEDEASKLVATGKLEDLEALRGIVNLLDVPRKPVVLIVKINSPLDHFSYKVRAELRDQQEWKTTDSEIGLSLGITPRVNADYSVTIHLVYVLDKRVQSESLVRVANGSSFFTDGSHFTSGTPVPIGEKKLPVVAIQVQLNDAPYVPVHRDPVP